MTERGAAVPVTERNQGHRRRPQHWKKRLEQQQQHRHGARVAMYDAICRLHQDGATVAAMARRLKISRTTVYRQLRRGTPPEPKTCTRRSSDRVLAPYIPYLIERWRGGNVTGQQLFREIQAQGYPYSSSTVRRLIASLRRASEAGRPPEMEQSPYTRPQGPSARAVSFVVMTRPQKRSRLAQLYLEQLCQIDSTMAQLYELALSFLTGV
jgi:transposase